MSINTLHKKQNLAKSRLEFARFRFSVRAQTWPGSRARAVFTQVVILFWRSSLEYSCLSLNTLHKKPNLAKSRLEFARFRFSVRAQTWPGSRARAVFTQVVILFWRSSLEYSCLSLNTLHKKPNLAKSRLEFARFRPTSGRTLFVLPEGRSLGGTLCNLFRIWRV